MKNIKTTYILALILTGLMTISSCDNDDTNQNQNQCDFPGLTVYVNQNIYTQVTEADLVTDYFPNNNGPGIAAVEVYDMTNPNNFVIVSKATVAGEVDNSANILIAGNLYPCIITCQRGGTVVGEEFRFDIVIPSLSNAEAELCVVIDSVNP